MGGPGPAAIHPERLFFAKWATLQSAPGALLDKYHVNFCLLERGSPMATVLPLLPNWEIVYSDEKSLIFVRVQA